MNNPIRVVILDHDAAFCQSVRVWLESTGDITVVGEANEEGQMIEEMHSRHPGVILANLATLGGPEGVTRIVDHFPESRLIILHDKANDPRVLKALQQGAVGHLMKGALQPTEIIDAIRLVIQGKSVLSPAIAGQLVEKIVRSLWTDTHQSENHKHEEK